MLFSIIRHFTYSTDSFIRCIQCTQMTFVSGYAQIKFLIIAFFVWNWTNIQHLQIVWSDAVFLQISIFFIWILCICDGIKSKIPTDNLPHPKTCIEAFIGTSFVEYLIGCTLVLRSIKPFTRIKPMSFAFNGSSYCSWTIVSLAV